MQDVDTVNKMTDKGKDNKKEKQPFSHRDQKRIQKRVPFELIDDFLLLQQKHFVRFH